MEGILEIGFVGRSQRRTRGLLDRRYLLALFSRSCVSVEWLDDGGRAPRFLFPSAWTSFIHSPFSSLVLFSRSPSPRESRRQKQLTFRFSVVTLCSHSPGLRLFRTLIHVQVSRHPCSVSLSVDVARASAIAQAIELFWLCAVIDSSSSARVHRRMDAASLRRPSRVSLSRRARPRAINNSLAPIFARCESDADPRLRKRRPVTWRGRLFLNPFRESRDSRAERARPLTSALGYDSL